MIKIIKTIKKFGITYTIFYTFQKLGLIKELPVRFLLKRQKYYASLSPSDQKKELAEFYINAIGKTPDFDNPKSFTEKIQWIKFNQSTQIKGLLSDKYEAPKYVAEHYPNIKIIPQLGVWDKAEDIDFSKLPQQFVLKCNHGSAMNIIVKDKSKLNIAKTRKKLNDWLKVDYDMVNGMYENHYKFINRKIIAETYIEEPDGNLHDYKFHCFMGEPKFIEFIGDRLSNTHTIHSSIYTADWKKTDIAFNNDTPYEQEFSKPEKFPQMLELAKEMAKDYNYVRVDFYYINNEIYFGELTFTPDSGIIKFNPPQTDEEWGTYIKL